MKDLKEVTAVILGGGLGTRLRSKVSDRPKILADIKGRPFLTYLLEQLISFDIRYVVLCTGYLGEQIKETFKDSYRNLRLVYSQESSPLGTAGALRKAIPFFSSELLLVMNGDSYCEADLRKFFAWHGAKRANATLLLTEVSDVSRYGKINVDENGVILRFEEKKGRSGSGWINAGIYLLNCTMLSTIPDDRAVSLEREIFPSWIGCGLYGYRCPGHFLDIGAPETYLMAESFFVQKSKI